MDMDTRPVMQRSNLHGGPATITTIATIAMIATITTIAALTLRTITEQLHFSEKEHQSKSIQKQPAQIQSIQKHLESKYSEEMLL